MLFDDRAFLDSLSPEETDALRSYKRAGPYKGAPDYAQWLNAALLQGQSEQDAEETVELLDKATQRFRLPEPAILFRATFDYVMEPFSGPAFTYPAYMSVSRSDRSLARHFENNREDCSGRLLCISCPTGTPMALVEWTHPPDGADEGECLLPRQLHFLVTERRRGSHDELIRYAGKECAERLKGLEIWELEVKPSSF